MVLYNLLFVQSADCQKSVVNHNKFRSLYEQIVKNALKTKKMPKN